MGGYSRLNHLGGINLHLYSFLRVGWWGGCPPPFSVRQTRHQPLPILRREAGQGGLDQVAALPHLQPLRQPLKGQGAGGGGNPPITLAGHLARGGVEGQADGAEGATDVEADVLHDVLSLSLLGGLGIYLSHLTNNG